MAAEPRTGHPVVRLSTDELMRGPWVFARHVLPPEEDLELGALVEVLDASGRFIGHALWNGVSDVRLRFLSRTRRSALDKPRAFLAERLRAADQLRRRVLRLEGESDAYRIVHAEGDDLSGLIVDRLGSVLVCEFHALGFFRLRAEIERALAELYPGFPVIHRVPRSARANEGFSERELAEIDGLPEAPEIEIHEHGLSYPVRPGVGHKTGWFCDQRDNRKRIGALGAGREVLDLCTNAGGFALHAARSGARRVRAVDLDEQVLERAVRAARSNGLAVEFIHADAFNVLRAELASADRRAPELVVLDPHKLVVGKAQLESGKKKYSDLNHLALSVVRPGGLLATFSCSGAVDLPTFLGIVFGAARRAGREVKLLDILGAAPDHPQRPDFPRSRYLKGALLAVDR